LAAAMVCVHQMMDYFGMSQKKHTVAYVEIKWSSILVKNVDFKIREWMQGSYSDQYHSKPLYG
jgi:hypothetical protein